MSNFVKVNRNRYMWIEKFVYLRKFEENMAKWASRLQKKLPVLSERGAFFD